MRIQRSLLCLALAVGACNHDQPFETAATATDQPFQPGAPVRLTYNSGKDLRPAWTADGNGLYYAWQQLGGTDRDRCLAEMPGSGGRNLQIVCNLDLASADSADLYDSPTPSPDAMLLFTRGAGGAGSVVPDHNGIFFGTQSSPGTATEVRSLPFTLPGAARTIGTIGYARWTGPTRLMYLAQSVDYTTHCQRCPLDTLITGQVVAEMSLGSVPATSIAISVTAGATSMDMNPARDTLYYTLWGDSRVYRLTVSNPQLTVAHDFGARGIARDVAVWGQQLVAVVGGRVTATVDSIFGPVQYDSGGPLVSADLVTGTEVVLPADQPLFFRRPSFAPGGSSARLVAEGYALTISPSPTPDTLISSAGDLYLFESP